jgi:hypothetical protein
MAGILWQEDGILCTDGGLVGVANARAANVDHKRRICALLVLAKLVGIPKDYAYGKIVAEQKNLL